MTDFLGKVPCHFLRMSSGLSEKCDLYILKNTCIKSTTYSESRYGVGEDHNLYCDRSESTSFSASSLLQEAGSFESYKSKQISFFANLFLSVSRTKSVKNVCLRFAIFSCNTKLQNIFEIVLRKC